MTDVAVRLENLGKCYRLGGGQRPTYRSIRESLSSAFATPLRRVQRPTPKQPLRDLWAIRDVSFEVKHGEVLGIIGRNGAGKSTLLKVLSRITEPTTGYADVFGRVGSLLEVGTGFHPELSGRENIFLNGAILGMSRQDIRRRFDEIVSFAELERFLDTPVKHYSSGMYMRLGFSVAAHLEPDVLVVDEVLAVGDAEFQRKCLGKMQEVAGQGRTVLFVSHNMAAMQRLASSAVVLQQGRAVMRGPVGEAIAEYAHLTLGTATTDLSDRIDRQGDGRMRFRRVETISQNDRAGPLAFGGKGAIVLHYEATAPLHNVAVNLPVHATTGEPVVILGSELVGSRLDVATTTGTITCSFDKVPFVPGTYTFNVFCTANGILADWVIEAARFEVIGGDYYGTGRIPPQGYGAVAVPHSWHAQ